jgi:hypothetical protein
MVVIFLEVISVAPIVVVICAGSNPQSLVVISESAVEVAFVPISVGAITKSVGVLGIEPDRLCVVGDGAVVIPLEPYFMPRL